MEGFCDFPERLTGFLKGAREIKRVKKNVKKQRQNKWAFSGRKGAPMFLALSYAFVLWLLFTQMILKACFFVYTLRSRTTGT